ncbi:MAG: PorT family protein [Bacteroidetes bacterium]|nr:PorT family protein [Bacteroidota bacterium]
MKRIFLIALLIIPFTMVSNAQIKFGIKAGITSTSIKADDVINVANDPNATTYNELKVKGQNAKVGFQGGLMARITIVKLYVQPELLFTSTSGEVEVSELYNGTVVDGTQKIKEQKFNQIDIPIMVGYKIGPARIQGGPIATIVLNSTSALKDYNNYEEEFNGATWGYQVGLGLDLGKKITIDAKYEGNLSKLGDGIKVAGETRNFDSRNSQFVVTLGYFF